MAQEKFTQRKINLDVLLGNAEVGDVLDEADASITDDPSEVYVVDYVEANGELRL